MPNLSFHPFPPCNHKFRTCSFKVKFSEDPNKFQVDVPWSKAKLWALKRLLKSLRNPTGLLKNLTLLTKPNSLVSQIYVLVERKKESEVAQSCPTLCDPMDCTPTRLLCPWGFSRQEHWSGICVWAGASQTLDEIAWQEHPERGLEKQSPTFGKRLEHLLRDSTKQWQ